MNTYRTHTSQVKLVDVEKVEWLNRRSYSAIGLFLGREGRVLLRSDLGLEDWFELLDVSFLFPSTDRYELAPKNHHPQECTQSSKQRRQALRSIQGPRSRASLAAPPTHASLQSSGHMGLGGTFSSALEDWLMTRNKTSHSINGHHHHHFPLMLSDSVPDLSGTAGTGSGGCGPLYNSENTAGLSTNHSTPQRVPAHHHQMHLHHHQQHQLHQHMLLNNNNHMTRYSANAGYPLRAQNTASSSSYSSGFCGTPLRQHQIHQLQPTAATATASYMNGGKYVVLADEDDNGVEGGGGGSGHGTNNDGVQLRRGLGGGVVMAGSVGSGNGFVGRRCDNEKDEWMYRRPLGPTDLRHSRE